MDCDDTSHQQVKSNQLSHSKPDLPPLNRAKRGCALIMSNGFETSTSMRSRTAESRNDLVKMEILWQTEIGCTLFEGHVHSNLSSNDMRKLLIKFASMKDRYEFLVIYISTHGGKPNPVDQRPDYVGFYGEDEKNITENELMSYFRNDTCTQEGVPKFFILDYCRGFKDDESKKNGECEDGDTSIRAAAPVPFYSDTVTVYATHRGHATGEIACGSYLTHELYMVFREYWTTHSLLSMLTMTNKRMKERIQKGTKIKSMSIFESSLVDEFTFYETHGTASCTA